MLVHGLHNHANANHCATRVARAGTGLLAVALGPLAASYVASDLDFLVPLLRKNLALNDAPAHVRTEALDWDALRALAPPKREDVFRRPERLALVLAVDSRRKSRSA